MLTNPLTTTLSAGKAKPAKENHLIRIRQVQVKPGLQAGIVLRKDLDNGEVLGGRVTVIDGTKDPKSPNVLGFTLVKDNLGNFSLEPVQQQDEAKLSAEDLIGIARAVNDLAAEFKADQVKPKGK